MRLYVAGPMRGYPRYNFDQFDAARDLLWSLEIEPVSPADLDRAVGFDPNDSIDHFDVPAAMRRDIAVIINPTTDGIVRLKGWERSQGVSVEMTVNYAVNGLLFDVVYDEDDTMLGIEEVG